MGTYTWDVGHEFGVFSFSISRYINEGSRPGWEGEEKGLIMEC